MFLDFFKKPSAIPQLDSSKVLQDVAGQIGSIPALSALTEAANNATNAQYRAAIGQLLPGYQSDLAKSQANVSSFLRGELPQDVIDSVRRNTAFQSAQGGFGIGSGMGRNLVARDFGLTSLDLINRGQNYLGQNLNFAAGLTPGRLSPQQFLMGPQDFLQIQSQNNQIDMYNKNRKSGFDQFIGNLIPMGINALVQGGIGAATGGTGNFMNLFGGNPMSPSSQGSPQFYQQYTPSYNPWSSPFASNTNNYRGY